MQPIRRFRKEDGILKRILALFAVLLFIFPTLPGARAEGTTYAVTATASEGGKITPTNAQVTAGDSVTLRADAYTGYTLADVLVNGVSRGPQAWLTLTNITQDIQVRALFVYQYTPSPGSLPFADVQGNTWYYDPVCFVWERGLMKGVGTTTFAPQAPMTRAMLATVLWRMAGAPAGSDMGFVDVSSQAYYFQAVAWASQNGVVQGVGGGRFDPDGLITRETLATMVYRYLQARGAALPLPSVPPYTDAWRVSSWARDAVSVLSQNGLLKGKNDAVFDPAGTATRAEVAAVLQRLAIFQ